MRIGAVELELGDTLRHVRARQDPRGLRVHVDGLERRRAPGAHPPPSDAIVTSHLDDDAIHALPHAWPWGGTGAVEVTLAVRGEARLAGERARSADGRFALLHALLPAGAKEIRVEGDGEVADFVATARLSP